MPNPRKPTALRILQGNPGKRKLPPNEPKPEVGAERSGAMTREARAVWGELSPILTRNGVLTEMDGPALEHLCNIEANRRELVRLKERLRKPDDELLRLKVMVEERKLSPILAALYGRFGMTPSDRSKVSVEPKKPESKLAGFLGGA